MTEEQKIIEDKKEPEPQPSEAGPGQGEPIPPGTRCERMKKGRQCAKTEGHVGPHEYMKEPEEPPAQPVPEAPLCVSCFQPLRTARSLGQPGTMQTCLNTACYRQGLVTLISVTKSQVEAMLQQQQPEETPPGPPGDEPPEA